LLSAFAQLAHKKASPDDVGVEANSIEGRPRMAEIIAAALGRLKGQLQRFLSVEAVGQVAYEMGLEWKKTPLTVPRTVALFARQIMAGNISMPELVRLAEAGVTPEAYCTARGRLPVEVLRELLGRTCRQGDRQVRGEARHLWKRHRVWHMDGSSFSMPDTPELEEAFRHPVQQLAGCSFPVAHMLCLFDVSTGMISEAIIAPYDTHDLSNVRRLHPAMQAGDIVVADRHFESYAHIATLLGKGLHLVAPAHQKRPVNFVRGYQRVGRWIKRRRVRRLGTCDQLVRWSRPLERPPWLTREEFYALPKHIEMREIKRVVRMPDGRLRTVVLVTTLLDARKYPAQDVVRLLGGRWQVEVNLRHLKSTMNMAVLRSKSVSGVEKELCMFLIIYNLVRLIMLEAADRQQVAMGRISFADALYWIRHGDLGHPIPLLEEVPWRPGRLEPRVLKRRRQVYSLMRKPREVLRKALREKK
jgi:hypothetical protein